jgi:MFS family permease
MTFLYVLGRSMVSPISPQYYQAIHISIFGIGVLLGGFGASFLVFEAFWGFVSSRVWSRWTFLGLLVVSSLLPLPMSRPQPFAVLFAIQVISGLCFGGVGVLPRLLVPRLVEPSAAAKSFGYLGMVYGFGTMVGSLLGGAVYGVVGLSMSFIVAGLATVASVPPLFFLKLADASHPPESPSEHPSEGAGRPAPPLALPVLVALGLVALTTAASSVFYSYLLPNILIRDPSFSASVFEVSIVIALFSFSSGAFQPIMGLRGYQNPARWILSAIFGSGLTFVLLAYATGIPEVYLLSFLAGIASSAITPLALSVLSTGVTASRLGSAFGLYGAAEDSGIIVGALAGGFLWADFGTRTVFLAMAALVLGTAAAYVTATRRAAPAVVSINA